VGGVREGGVCWRDFGGVFVEIFLIFRGGWG